ncbi:YacL family protein [Vibrio fluvialis]|uniref:UPF0231 family protein n=1 Tax=Vibrio fluvialis TaxID=676 RepID=UPI0005095B46|nr:YacL family protein [Vibrio fluvialis]EKO3486939.1 YacL family protein [Vibrio fluvialis]MBL4284264.1 YacL family protein [Vibrio fluvialis]MBY8035960.1 YacL family protein [Vibrio fluvialis]MBY8194961.1 YacL family protein [Vibrio fluvialis]
MEFEFTKNTLLGEYYVTCSMEHQIVARWLQEEVAQDRTKIEQVLALLEKAHQYPAQEWQFAGREISVMICGDEVTVQDNALNYGHDVEFESEFELYESESVAQCGLEDFESLLIQWQDFLAGY